MSLAAGTRLGPYEVLGLIGSGGMGEVYKGRDTRLDRSVAIKILPAELSADPDRRTRFEREARAVAALSHPHICTLYDIGSTSSPQAAGPGTSSSAPGPTLHYLVMEHLAGETLAQRLTRGPLPLAQALDLAAQIADALDAAHKHGIIHRDLKPGNVMLTTGGAGRSGVTSAKLLDFGLAKLAAHGERPAAASLTALPTQPTPLTGEGTIVGTLPYMAPEQLEGKEADARTDLWALGAILYEMVTGRRAFEGESQVSLIGNIMNAEPAALAALHPLTPPALDRVIRKCLAKHPDGRWDTAHDVADELRWISQTSGTAAVRGTGPRRRRAGWALAIGAGVVAVAGISGVAGWLAARSAPGRPLTVTHSLIDLRPAEELTARSSAANPTPGGSRTALAWTPDGQALVFVGRQGGVQQLYVRRLDAAEARPLAGTEGALLPAVSPDGQWVAFWADGAIRKVPLAGGPAMDLASGFRQSPSGFVWDSRGRLFFSSGDRAVGGSAGSRIWQLPPDGDPVPVTTVGEAESAHVLPCPLPGGRVVLYTVRKRQWSWGDEEIVAQTLATGERKVLLRDAADARYVPTGHLVFLRRGTLFAVRFDAERLEVQGAPVAVLDTVAQALTAAGSGFITGAGQFAIAPTGTLAWLPGPIAPYHDAALVTVDRHGQVTPLPAPVRSYSTGVRLSPDGRQLAVTINSLTDVSLWLCDVRRGTLTLLLGGGEVMWPVWAPDGRRLGFSWLKDGRRSLAVQPADGTAPPQTLVAGVFSVSSWTPDGRQLAAVSPARDIVIVSVEGRSASARPLIETPQIERWPTFSPDGRWLVYGSNVSGRDEVYVRPYPGPGQAEQLSVEGGSNPAWNPNGRELFFLGPWNAAAGRGSMMAVEFEAASPRRVGRPKRLFEFDPTELQLGSDPALIYSVAPDGQRFFAKQRRPAPPLPPVTHINLIQNWFEELKAKVPAK